MDLSGGSATCFLVEAHSVRSAQSTLRISEFFTPCSYHGSVRSHAACPVPRRLSSKLCAASNFQGRKTSFRATSQNSDGQVTASPGSKVTASDVVRRFYEAVNARDVDAAIELLSDDCVYEDLLYPKAFSGKEAVRRHLSAVLSVVPAGLSFCIDDCTAGDSHACGLMWHAELDGRPAPFSSGCSFYRCGRQSDSPDAPLLIQFARDAPESVFKPGEAGLNVLKVASWLRSRLP